MKLLVIDDDALLLRLIKDQLTDIGHMVDTATDGQEALSFVSSELLYDLIISDVRMPNLNGMNFGLELRKRKIPTPIVFFSAEPYGAKAYEEELKKIGNSKFVEDKNLRNLFNLIQNSSEIKIGENLFG